MVSVTRTLLTPLYKFHRCRISRFSYDQVIDDRKYDGSSEHDDVPIHRGRRDRNRDREEHKDPNHKEKHYGANIDKDAGTAEGPAA